MADGGILIISCPGYSQTHHRRAVSPSIHVKLIKISQQERLTGALCRLEWGYFPWRWWDTALKAVKEHFGFAQDMTDLTKRCKVKQ